MKKDAPYPVVYEDHDGSWTWSIEMGEPFEDDHRVLATDYGYPDRKEARSAMEQAMLGVSETLRKEKMEALEARKAALEADETEDDEPSPPAKSGPAKNDSPVPEEGQTAVGQSESGVYSLPQWGVLKKNKIVALFSSRNLARAYVDGDGDLTVKKFEFQTTGRPVAR